jgi:transposase-like protein
VIARAIYRETLRKIAPTRLQAMVADVAEGCKSAREMSEEFKPRAWRGILAVDEKKIPLACRGELWCYEAIDLSGDVVHFREVPECSVTEAVKFLEEVKATGYRCLAITTDLDTVLTLAIEAVYGKIPHQYCIKHALAILDKTLGYGMSERQRQQRRNRLRGSFERLPLKKGLYLVRASKTFLRQWQESRGLSKKAQEIAALRELCRKILTARTQGEALDLLAYLRRRHSSQTVRKWKAIAFLERHWVRLMAHHRTSGLPRTNNMAEAFNKQLMRRLKTLEHFGHRATAVNYMKLLVAYLRLKPYTDCRKGRRHLNGKSRLEAAGVKLRPQDWLSACLKI